VYGTRMYEAFELWVRVSMAFERRGQGSSEGGSIEPTARNLDDGYCKRRPGSKLVHNAALFNPPQDRTRHSGGDRDIGNGYWGALWGFPSAMGELLPDVHNDSEFL
jgi:hypothetical protein